MRGKPVVTRDIALCRRNVWTLDVAAFTKPGTPLMSGVWVFGYGSLIWRPDMAYRERRIARVRGWKRRFWQGSHDHRGLPHAPGRVVTLVPDPEESCEGVAYLIDETVAEATFAGLDHREKNGYGRHEVRLELRGGGTCAGIIYIASAGNLAYLGPAPEAEMVEQIRHSAGPSGANIDYLKELAAALRTLEIDDPHVFTLDLLANQSMPQHTTPVPGDHTMRHASSKVWR